MPVTIHAAPAGDLTPAEIERWRAVPAAVAVDLSRRAERRPEVRESASVWCVCHEARPSRSSGRVVARGGL